MARARAAVPDENATALYHGHGGAKRESSVDFTDVYTDDS
jgi:hypothetical protein